jgi:hypothetical protein
LGTAKKFVLNLQQSHQKPLFPGAVILLHHFIFKTMADEPKVNPADLAVLIVIVLILLYFPYIMISEHSQDAIANSFYSNGR